MSVVKFLPKCSIVFQGTYYTWEFVNVLFLNCLVLVYTKAANFYELTVHPEYFANILIISSNFLVKFVVFLMIINDHCLNYE